ncbi:ABC transporter permease [Burkholderia sp. MSh2]|uniref:Iron-hydroxamate transporter permease subunit n=1 Tax=Burkholderia paludis TaxID=1506587 RepID=A0A6P2QWF0_9BURK|nr:MULTISPECIES: Fe(3+)-hydroxamate ABC transporter permease FhuB [Burkholderia]KEZ03314.1 ABC transporter permease [Burkholderia sp. MSh2]CAB3766716.1 Iron(3+)-hydroxamate import system permease protein FhuB [Burkholderia paludis]VWC27342.1 iron-hydroxamate transporter permease subunit [Burkholderia paludis]
MKARTMVVDAGSRAWALPALLAAATLWAVVHTLSTQLPAAQWAGVLTGGADVSLAQLVVRYAWLPRVVVSITTGAALALAGVVFQQVLRNPLAEPLTLGVSSGASLALSAASIMAPALVAGDRFAVALGGATLAIAATLALTWRKGFAPVSVTLAGMVVSLYGGALAVLLAIVNERSLVAVFIWGAGSLVQNGWEVAAWLVPRVAGCMIAAWLLARPLALFALDDRGARQLGLSVTAVRLVALAIAVSLSALATSAVGVIGFIGLGGPALARLAGARRLRDQLAWAPCIGALLLTLADQLVQCLPGVLGERLPTGAALALLGGPLLLAMLRRVRTGGVRAAMDTHDTRRRSVARFAVPGVVVLALAVWVSLHFAVTIDGWQWTPAAQWPAVAFWRVPRLAASLGAGVMVALAGTVLQRLTGNPMASPDLLGVSGGAMLGLLVVALGAGVPSAPLLLGGASAGALTCLAAIMAFGRRAGFAPDRMLLVGMAISAFSQAAIVLATARGGVQAELLRALLFGSTYVVLPQTAIAVWVCAVAAGALAWLALRWLDILPLGADVATALGVRASHARAALFAVAAILTAGATIVIGPMSFVGLMAPHFARLLGFTRARSQLVIAALVGGLLMVAADWLGRNLLFPQQLPAGILATLVGGPYLLWLLRR